MKIFKKLKSVPKAAFIPVVFFFFISLLFTMLFFTVKVKKEQKVTMTPVNIAGVSGEGSQSASSNESSVPQFVKEVMEKEKKTLVEKKQYFGETGVVETKTGENSKSEIEGRSTANLGALPPPPPPPSPKYTATGEMKETEESDPRISIARSIVQKIYAKEANAGEVFSSAKKKNKEQPGTEETATKPSTTPLTHLGLIPGKFYRARTEVSITSEKPNAVVIATLEEGLKGAKLFGKITGVFENENRLDVVFDKLVWQNKEYHINAIAFDLSKTQGIASSVKYNILEKIFIQGSLGFSEAMLNAMREDEQQQVMSALGTVETTEVKKGERTREGLLAGGSQAFSESKRIVSQYHNKVSDKIVILAKGTPFYVMFLESQ